MTSDQFQYSMGSIFSVFGRAEYPAERVRMIYDEVKDLTQHEFDQIVANFVGSFRVKYAPMPSHFREEAYAMRKRRFEKAVEHVWASEDPRDKRPMEAVLKRLGANSLTDAIFNKPRGES